MTGLHYMPMVTIGILALLATLYMSYRQTAAAYPGGGGAYIVAKDNLGMGAGVAAGHGATAGLHAQRCRWNLSRGRRSPVGSSNATGIQIRVLSAGARLAHFYQPARRSR